MNTKYAIIRTQGHQYRIEEGKDILIPRVDELKFDVLLVVDGEKIQIGQPTIEKHKVSLRIVEPLVKGEKIRVFKYKAKSRYRKTIGSRPQYSQIHIENIA